MPQKEEEIITQQETAVIEFQAAAKDGCEVQKN